VLDLVLDEPALRAGAASGILDKTARGALPEAGRLRGMVLLISPRNTIWILGPDERRPKPQ
jgi:hypothetical protein